MLWQQRHHETRSIEHLATIPKHDPPMEDNESGGYTVLSVMILLVFFTIVDIIIVIVVLLLSHPITPRSVRSVNFESGLPSWLAELSCSELRPKVTPTLTPSSADARECAPRDEMTRCHRPGFMARFCSPPSHVVMALRSTHFSIKNIPRSGCCCRHRQRP